VTTGAMWCRRFGGSHWTKAYCSPLFFKKMLWRRARPTLCRATHFNHQRL